MDPQSPPKRMTRARAAAKSGEPAIKTTKIVTAAAKARATSSTIASVAARSTTATKRKTRSDEADHDEEREDDDELAQPATAMRSTKAARGRPRKIVAEPAEAEPAPASAPTRATRTVRTKKVVEPVEEPVKPTRGRPRKIQPTQEAPEPAVEAPKKTTRSRAATLTKPAVKKTVTFDEPEKENVAPKSKEKAPAATGLRARPVRKPAVATRATRAAAKSAPAEDAKKQPLSPRKVTQMPVSRDTSEDELATMEKTPLKPLMRSPLKPPGGVLGAVRKLGFGPAPSDTSVTANVAALNPPELTGSLFIGSPARRPPSSPYKDAMKSPAKRVDGLTLQSSSAGNVNAVQGPASNLKASLLQSPAKRPQSPIKGLGFSAPRGTEQSQSPFKTSFLQSPAKRPSSPIKGFASSKQPPLELGQSPATRATLLSTPAPLNTVSRLAEIDADVRSHDDSEEAEGDDLQDDRAGGRR